MAGLDGNVDKICGYPLFSGRTQPVDWSNLYAASHNQFIGDDPSLIVGALPCQVKGNDEIQATKITKKRVREEQDLVANDFLNKSSFSTFVKNVDLIMQKDIQQTNLYFLKQTEKMRVELEEKRKNHRTNLIYILNDDLQRKLRFKDEEIARMSTWNSALEEKLRSLLMQCESWKIRAQNHAAMAASLQHDLEAAQANVGGNDTESTSSCCENDGQSNLDYFRRCRNCHRNEMCMLMLPCRHLCLCAECDFVTKECPICMSVKACSIQIIMS